MLLEFKHGGHALTKSAQDEATSPTLRSITVSPSQTGEDFDEDNMTPFRYLIDELGPDDLLPVSDATVTALDKLGNAIVDQPPDKNNPDSNFPRSSPIGVSSSITS
jgi:hypothetical protein